MLPIGPCKTKSKCLQISRLKQTDLKNYVNDLSFKSPKENQSQYSSELGYYSIDQCNSYMYLSFQIESTYVLNIKCHAYLLAHLHALWKSQIGITSIYSMFFILYYDDCYRNG